MSNFASMYQLLDSDTICAISTPAGVGGIAVIRVSGPDAITIVDSIWHGHRLRDARSHSAHLGDIVDPTIPGEPLDTALVTVFKAPGSFTGENVVEISVHGSRWIQRELVNLLIRTGCRMAQPGEFTRRAFANGRLDLAQAEAVADVIAASSRSAHRLAASQMRGDFSKHISELRDKLIEIASLLELELDFSEEDVEFASRQQLKELAESLLAKITGLASSFSTGAALKDGIPVAIVGEPNAGKSTLLNSLLHDNRAIVSDIPGTTRDTIEDTMEIDGVLYRFIDTAGIRETSDSVENLGIERSYATIARARIVIWLITPDLSPTDYQSLHTLITDHLPEEATLITVLNKIDTIANQTDTTASKIDITANQTDSAVSQSEAVANQIEVAANQIDAATNQIDAMAFQPDDPGSRFDTITNQIDAATNQIDTISGHVKWILPTQHQISAANGTNIKELIDTLHKYSGANETTEADLIVTNARHYESLTHAADSLQRVINGINTNLSGDFIAQDLRETIHHLSSITGTITTTDLLQTIFQKFCIGK